MNDITSLPARIVVIGTSKKKLAERFKDLSPERRASRRSSPGVSSRRSSHPPPEPRATFLRDDYMDNDLFEKRRRALREKRPAKDEYLSDLSEEDEEVVRLQDYGPRRQRQFDLMYNGNSRHGGSPNGYEDLDEAPMRPRYPRRRRFVYVNRLRFRPLKFVPLPTPLPKRIPVSIPLEERISILRKHNQIPFAHRNYRSGGLPFGRRNRPGFNLKRLQHFVPRDRERFGVGRRDRRGGGRKQYSDNPRTKMTLSELDQELDAYMKSSKHPRVVV